MNSQCVGWLRRLASLSVFALVLGCLAAPAWSQSTTSGALSGNVTDPTGAAIPGAKITVTDNATGSVHNTTSQANGGYDVPSLVPGQYTVQVEVPGFEKFKQSPVVIGLSNTTNLPVKLTVGATTQTVEITGEAPLIEPTQANQTTVLTAAVMENIPDPGNDITFMAEFAPGAYITHAGSFNGNGSVGYTIDGADYNDPFNNDNNSGSTNLLLGGNDIAEISVNTNSYSVDQGRYSGGQVNYTSKTGSNNYHGNISYQWNGRVLNAYDYFAKATPGQQPAKPEDNVNNYSGSFGGPLLHNKLFFFFDEEGTFINLPTSPAAEFPTAAFYQYQQNELGIGGYETSTTYTQNDTAQSATNPYKCLAATAPNIVANAVQPCGSQPNSVNEWPFYQKYYAPGLLGTNRWAPGGQYTLTPAVASGCPLLGPDEGGSATIPMQDPTYNPQVQNTGTKAGNQVPSDDGCVYTGTDYTSNTTWENLFFFRADWTKSQTDSVWAKFGRDAGLQATGVSPINTIFNQDSWQPEWTGSGDWAHTFSPTVTNDFSSNFLWYSAVFTFNNEAAAEAAVPYTMQMSTPAGTVGSGLTSFPQGRNIMQYGYVDNLTWTKSNHTFKFGANFRRDDTDDLDFEASTHLSETNGSYPDWMYGYTTSVSRSFPVSTTLPFRDFALDLFAGDTWQIHRNLTLIYGLRASHNSNPKDLQGNLGIVPPWADLSHPTNSSPSTGALNVTTLPVNAAVTQGQDLWTTVPMALYQPRVAITWQPRNNTLVKAGWGIFSSIPTTSSLETLFENPPGDVSSNGGYGSTNGEIAANGGTNGCPFNVLQINTSLCGALGDPGQQYSGVNAIYAGKNLFSQNFGSGAPSCTYYQANALASGIPATSSQLSSCVPQEAFHGLDPHLHPSYSEQWSVGITHQFGRQFSLNTQYVGNRSIEGSQAFDPMAYQSACATCYSAYPYPYIAQTSINSKGVYSDADPRFSSWSETYYNQSGIWSTFNGLETQATERLQHGIQFDLSYTWAHPMADIAPPCLGCLPAAPGHTFGSGTGDIRNDVSGNYTWTMPFHASGDWWGRLVNDWQMSGALFLESGSGVAAPSGATYSTDLLLGATGTNPAIQMPNTPIYAKGITFPLTTSTGAAYIGSPGTHVDRVQWFYPGSFGTTFDSTNVQCYNPLTNQDIALSPTCLQFGYQYGAINQPGPEAEFRGPGFEWQNMFFTKQVALKENMKLRIDIQAYNLFNHANFSSASMTAASFIPSTSTSTDKLNSSLFEQGAISSTTSPSTGLLGSGLGGKTAARMIAFQGKITF